MWCQKCLSSEFPKQSPRREDMKRGLEGRALEDRGFEKSREKGFRERSFKVHTERSNQKIASDEASKVVWSKGSYGRASRMKFQQCLLNDFSKQSPRGDAFKRGFRKELDKRGMKTEDAGCWCGAV